MEKDSAISYVREKEFENFEPQIRALFVSKESSLFFKRKDDSGFAFMLDNNNIQVLMYFDSLTRINEIVNDLKKSGWELSKSAESFETYASKQSDIKIAYFKNLEDNTHMIQIEKNISKQ